MSVNTKNRVDTEEDYDEKIRLVFPSLLSYAQSRIYNKSDAFDVSQEAALILSQKRDEFDSSKSFHSWAFRICHFQILKYLKNKKRNREFGYEEPDSIVGLSQSPKSNSSPESLIYHVKDSESKCPFGIFLEKELLSERNKILSQMSNRLSGKQKQFFDLSILGNSKVEVMKIMEITSINYSAIKTRVIKRLRFLFFNSKDHPKL